MTRDFTSFFLPSFIAMYRFNANFKFLLFDLVSHHLTFHSFCLFVKLDTYLAYLSQISTYSNDRTPEFDGSFLRRHRILKKFGVFLPGNAVGFGILNQGKQENFFQLTYVTHFFHILGVQQWIVRLKGETQLLGANKWNYRCVKGFPDL